MKNILNQNSKETLTKKIDWKVVQLEMKNKFGLDIYESWLRKIDFVDEFTNYILLSVSTRFIRDWITSRYLDQILQIIKVYKKRYSKNRILVAEIKIIKI
jgi:ATPase involved in DNA replication initiation